MPLTNLELLRLRSGDPYRSFQEQQRGDGSSIIYQLASFPVLAASETIYIDGTPQADPGDYGLNDDRGLITWVSAPTDGSIVLVSGQASAFSDTEFNDVLTRAGLIPSANAGNIRDALLEVLEILMVSEARREKWSAGDLSSDPTKTFTNLLQLHQRLIDERKRGAIDEGGLEEWSVEQQFFR